ncbi:hypothetical protein E0Z10_g1918 [Xylaria hypoxylon]|uniref:Peptidase M28 domain-containing protein n=1 Tax=Xylaria hypoxylon TaxID=37992 RepID=A0A4Z0YSD9_9PEZI|nr:hypothetical protein E0Z10_g1918 [Xylaria hypoxylon]
MQLHLLLLILHIVSAFNAHLQPRLDECTALLQDNEGDSLTVVTFDRTAGIGAEFETPVLYLQNSACDKANTDAAKRKVVAGRIGLNFELTADTIGRPGKLQLEYILKGETIKVGSGDAARAGAAAAADLMAWRPWNGGDTDNIEVADSQCNPWRLGAVCKGTKPEDIEWAAQVTAPMPLEAVYSLMKESASSAVPLNILNGGESRRTGSSNGLNLVFVPKGYFMSKPNGIDLDDVSDDMLGFCSLVLTYAKIAQYFLQQDQSPKLFLNFYATDRVQHHVSTSQVENAGVVDKDYCSGSVGKPVPKNKFSELMYENSLASVNIKTWIDGIGSGSSGKDALSVFDESIDGSIGGLGRATENIYNSQRAVPLFEFRDLPNYPLTKDFESFMGDVDAAVQALHETFANAPQRKKRDVPASCYANVTSTTARFPTPSLTPPTFTPTSFSTTSFATSSDPASITSPTTPSCELYNQDPDQGITQAFCLCDDSITLSVLPATSAQSESCAYKSIPTGTSAIETVTVPTQVWTSNCAACTLVGGIADVATCTRVSSCTPTTAPSPTIAAWVGNLSTINIGNAEDANGGMDLATEMFGKLKAMCNGSNCTADHAEMDNVETVIVGEEEPLKPAMYLQDATFTSQDAFENMLSVGISAWVSVLNDPTLGLCKNVTYEADADETGSGCGEGPIPTSRLRRKVRRDDGAVLWERRGLVTEESRLAERCLDLCDSPITCHYDARTCSAPNEITVVMADGNNPYANRLNIAVTLDKVDDNFLCEDITAALTAAVALLAPELLEIDALEGVELEAICGIIDDPASIIGNLQDTVRVAGGSRKAV